MALPEKVNEEIRGQVHSRDREKVRRLLGACVTSLTPSTREQVLLGIIRLAGRNVDKLQALIEIANEDYRNIEYWYWFPEESRAKFFKGARAGKRQNGTRKNAPRKT